MKKTTLTPILIFFTILISFSQNLEKLKGNNGFRGIKLGANINEYPDFVKRVPSIEKLFGPFNDYQYIFDIYTRKDYKSIGNAKIRRIFANTIDKKIFKIEIITEVNYEIIELLTLAYGEPARDSMTKSTRLWKIDNIECTITGILPIANNLILTYVDADLERKFFEREKVNKKKKALSEF